MKEHSEEINGLQTLKLNLANNLALVSYKLEDWRYACDCARKALDLDPDNTKALYRRALCYVKIEDYDRANTDIVKAIKLEPNNANFRTTYGEIKEKRK